MFSMVAAKLAVLGVFVLVGLETYVRWTLNQNFTFLGGGELEALTYSAFALLLGLNYVSRVRKE